MDLTLGKGHQVYEGSNAVDLEIELYELVVS